MKLSIFGAPGVGKGTQAKIISKQLQIAHISTGDLLRAEMRNKTEIGKLIEDKMNGGQYVEDEIVNQLLINRLKEDDCKRGFILDGYPRNIEQAKLLPKMSKGIDEVIVIEVPDERIVKRMSGRRVCSKCEKVYHVEHKKPIVDGICDDCKTPLDQREDDKEETVKKRLELYHEVTSPIINYYEQFDIVSKVSGVGKIEHITENILENVWHILKYPGK